MENWKALIKEVPCKQVETHPARVAAGRNTRSAV